LSHLRKPGHISLGHLDYFYLQGKTSEQYLKNIIDTIILFSRLGLVVRPEKSNFIPAQIITALGFTLNSLTMTVKLTTEKSASLKQTCQTLLANPTLSVKEVAWVIGKIMSSFPGTNYAPLYYRHLERNKSHALKQNKGKFDAQMTFSPLAKTELCWKIDNIANKQYYISHGPPTLQITTDASLSGWGTECQGISTGGQWTLGEAQHHINYLELFATFLGLQTFPYLSET
jgi:hypothetical protein